MLCIEGSQSPVLQRVERSEGVFNRLRRSNSFFRREDKGDEYSTVVRKLSENAFEQESLKAREKNEVTRSVLDKLCRKGSFRISGDAEDNLKSVSSDIFSKREPPVLRRRNDGRRSVMNKLCRSGSFRLSGERDEKAPVKKLSSGSFSCADRPSIERRSLVEDCSRERSYRSNSLQRKDVSTGGKNEETYSRRSFITTKCEKNADGDLVKLCRGGSFLRKEFPKLESREEVGEGSLQATVYAPRQSQDKPGRPTTVLIVYPQGLERGGPMRPLSSDLNPPRIDSYRFSMANLEDSQDVDLDAILGELCALESQYDEALQATSTPAKPEPEVVHRRILSDVSQTAGAVHRTDSPDNDSAFSAAMSVDPRLIVTEPEVVHRRTLSDVSQTTGAVHRTDSPDNDSAFSDNVSLLSSSESSASSGRTETQMENGQTDGKAEKIRLALQKMKEASVKKLFIKVFSGDGSAKSLMVDETMTCGYVTRLLADKNHQEMGPQWALMEHLPDLHLERVYEDHEPLVDNLMIWTRDSKNRLLFVKRPERTMLFKQPELLSGPNTMTRGDNVDECSRNNMIEELFSGSCIPSMEGPLYVKSDSKKGWKRHHCILRASGLYYLPKDKVKTSYKDLVCLATFDVNQVYYGVGWRKKFKAPTEFCFALKHPSLQQPKSSKFIKFLCAEDPQTMHQWVLAIRMAKHGRQLLVNYRSILEECRLPSSDRIHETTTLGNARHSTISATSSLLDTASESGSSGCDVGFECDFPSGTIKRKPPKLPLTATTRQLKEIAVGNKPKHITFDTVLHTTIIQSPSHSLERAPSFESLPPPPPEVLENFVHPDEDLPPPPPPPRLAPPSAAFLQDLQRVMRRKWQVAQKCKLDTTTTPHEVLGFRDPPDYKETNVSNWVNEHYGKQNLYENVYRPGAGIQIAPNIQIAPVKKRPPPPPPPRSETTQLTTRTPQKC